MNTGVPDLLTMAMCGAVTFGGYPSLRNAPGVWRWERRGEHWWRVHDALNIEDGPYFQEGFIEFRWYWDRSRLRVQLMSCGFS